MRIENGQLRRWKSYENCSAFLPFDFHDKMFLVIDADGAGLREPGRVWVLMDGMLEHWAFFMVNLESEVISEAG
jgi:hypothetical protein